LTLLRLKAGACSLAFHQAYGPNGPISGPTGSPMNPHKIVITVADVAAAHARLKAAGLTVEAIESFPDFGNLSYFHGTDPEGHVYQICNR
jgi:predicted enzyme related to lactoylglutathione lyase